jgi:hypothetical protein
VVAAEVEAAIESLGLGDKADERARFVRVRLAVLAAVRVVCCE